MTRSVSIARQSSSPNPPFREPLAGESNLMNGAPVPGLDACCGMDPMKRAVRQSRSPPTRKMYRSAGLQADCVKSCDQCSSFARLNTPYVSLSCLVDCDTLIVGAIVPNTSLQPAWIIELCVSDEYPPLNDGS